MNLSFLHLLQSPEIRDFLKKAVEWRVNLLKCAEILSKKYTPEERKQILDYLALIPKIREKFETSHFLFCDKLALEQSTAKDLSRIKSAFFPEGATVDDLCCGMGGDSFFLPPGLSVTGVDLSPERVFMYEKNTALMGTPRKAILADACTYESTAGFFMIDPARRKSLEENQRNLENLEPSLEQILTLSKRYQGGMLKLPPGFPLSKIPPEAEIIYLGKRSDCRECLVLLGSLAQNPGKIRAILVQNGNVNELLSARDSFLDYSENHLSEVPLGKFLMEPVPLLVRSHLFEDFAEKNQLGVLSEGIAYLTGDTPLLHFGFHNYQVLDSAPLSTGAVRAMLKKHHIGTITLKKRGVEIVPEAEIKRLAAKGKEKAFLFYTRLAGEKIAILAREEEPYFKRLKEILIEEKKKFKIFPPGSQIFSALDLAPVENVRVVILGQDPYHNPGQAHGLCFSVQKGVPPPPSLVNIYQELKDDLGINPPSHGHLESWARQGVLLLNASLTVRAYQAASHSQIGWQMFTDTAVRRLSQNKEHLVFLLWGSHAIRKKELIAADRGHLILEAPHPSPLSAYRGFFGCRHFSKTNEFLRHWGLPEIDWNLE